MNMNYLKRIARFLDKWSEGYFDDVQSMAIKVIGWLFMMLFGLALIALAFEPDIPRPAIALILGVIVILGGWRGASDTRKLFRSRYWDRDLACWALDAKENKTTP